MLPPAAPRRRALPPLAVRLLLLPLLLLSASPREASAIGDPELEWYTVETDHFVLHYHAGLEEMARTSVAMCEEAHALLSPLLDWVPGAKTHVVLTDFGDSANGSAAVVPYNIVRLLGATPDLRGSLNDYDDWLRALIFHEYVHILHIDTMYGLADLINFVFGKTVAPNGSLPRWFTEGFATYHESARTAGGRVRSAQFKMTLRAQALQSKVFDIDLISGVSRTPPGARAWYMHGSHFLAWLAARYGEAALTAYAHLYGARIIPYGLNIVARQVFDGADLVTLYEQWVAAETADALATWVRVRALGGPTPVERIPERAHDHDHLRPRPGHAQLSYVRSDGYSARKIVLVDTVTGEEEEVRRSYGPGRVAWAPDGSFFVVAESNVVERLYDFQDLFRYDMASGELTQLTLGLRAREPAVSPDGRYVIFSAQRTGTSDLVLLDLESGATEVLDRGRGRDHHSTPAWFPDGRRVVLSRFVDGTDEDGSGTRDLFIFDLESRRYQAITRDRALDMEPTVSPDGRYVVWSSDRGGIFDLLLYDTATGRTSQLTRSITGLFSPSFSSDGRSLYATEHTALGTTVGVLDFEALRSADLGEPTPGARFAQEPVRYASPAVELDPQPYRPWRWLFPRAWLPEFVANLGFDGVLALALSGSDPVGLHGWFARFAYNTESESFGASVSYVYRGWPVDVQLRASRSVVERSFSASNAEQRYDEEQIAAGIDLVLPFPGVDLSHVLTASYGVTRYAAAEPFEVDHDPLGTSPRYPELGFFNTLSLSWSMYDVESYHYSISPELGYVLSGSATLRAPFLGADYTSFDLGWSATGYLPNPLLDAHVFALRYSGGIGWADYRRRGLFVIGGIPQEFDFVQALVQGYGVGGAMLRGYPQIATFGDQYHLANFEYRFPVWRIEEGLSTLPAFLDDLSGALFADYGGAFFGDFDLDKLKLGLGAELRLGFILGYALPYTLRVGYAYGVHEPGLHHLYGVLGGQF